MPGPLLAGFWGGLGAKFGRRCEKGGSKAVSRPPCTIFPGSLGSPKGAILRDFGVFGAMFSRGQFLCRKSDEKVAQNHPVNLSKLCEGYQKSLFSRFPKNHEKGIPKGSYFGSISDLLATKIAPRRGRERESNFGRDPSGLVSPLHLGGGGGGSFGCVTPAAQPPPGPSP